MSFMRCYGDKGDELKIIKNMRKIDFPKGPVVLALILGPMAETNFRKVLMLNQQSISFLYKRPIIFVILLFAVFSIILVVRKTKSIKRNINLIK